MRGVLIKAVVILLIAGLAAIALRQAVMPSDKVEVYIPVGSGAKEISGMLKEKGLITSKPVFYAVLKLLRKDKKLKSGLYEIAKNESVFGIINMISNGKTSYVPVVIPEGFTAYQIAERFALRGITDKEKFLDIVSKNKLEGYLFPDTYQFEVNSKPEAVINKMISGFNMRITEDMKKRASEIRGMDLTKIVILASIIEKEAKVASERPLISAVFYNRLKKHMYLDSCATVLFALGKHKEKLSIKDTKIDSPYNTYRNYGLPPGPICNPGIESINAALYPAKTDDLYFVVSSSGMHSFSKYFNEHLRNKQKKRGMKGE